MTCDKTPSICGLKVVRAAWQEKCHQDGCSKGGERAGQTVLRAHNLWTDKDGEHSLCRLHRNPEEGLHQLHQHL